MIRRTPLFVAALGLLFAPTLRADEPPKRSELFQTYCAQCHGEDGKAQTEEGKKKKARDFTNKKWQDSVSDDQLVSSVTKGREKMPKFGKKISPEEIKSLIQEVREIGGKKAS
jgi:cytochrome c6